MLNIGEFKLSKLLILLAGILVITFAFQLTLGLGRRSNTCAVLDTSEMNSFRAVFVTVPSIEVGKKIAHDLVSKRLAACVNIIPQITSVYEWEGKVEEDSELLLMIKTKSQNFDELEKAVKANHPYSVPEVIAVPIEQGSQQYLDWVNKNSAFSSSL